MCCMLKSRFRFTDFGNLLGAPVEFGTTGFGAGNLASVCSRCRRQGTCAAARMGYDDRQAVRFGAVDRRQPGIHRTRAAAVTRSGMATAGAECFSFDAGKVEWVRAWVP